jgi:hypothetical protein
MAKYVGGVEVEGTGGEAAAAIKRGADPFGIIGTKTYETVEPYVAPSEAAQIPGYYQTQKQLQQERERVAGLTAPTGRAATIRTRPQEEWRRRQLGLADLLTGIATGEAPSAADIAAQQQTERTLGAIMSAAASQPGHVGGRFRAAGAAQAEAGSRIAREAAAARIGEQQAAAQALGGLLGGARGQDIGLATGQAGLTQQMALANLQTEAGTQQMREQLLQNYMSMGMDFATAQTQANLDLERMRTEAVTQAAIASQTAAQEAEAGSGVGGLIGQLSDKRAKKAIKSGDADVEGMLDALKSYSFKYKNKEHGKDRELGVMAQDVDRSKMGKTLVERGKDGLMRLGGKNALGVLLASAANLNTRMRKLEGANA